MCGRCTFCCVTIRICADFFSYFLLSCKKNYYFYICLLLPFFISAFLILLLHGHFGTKSILNNLQCLYLISLKKLLKLKIHLGYHFPKKDEKPKKIHSYLVFPSNQTSNVFEAANKAKSESHKMAQSGYFIGQSLGSILCSSQFIICCF